MWRKVIVGAIVVFAFGNCRTGIDEDLNLKIRYLKQEQDGIKGVLVQSGFLEQTEGGGLRIKKRDVQSVQKGVDKAEDM
jgi:hypothetical protein